MCLRILLTIISRIYYKTSYTYKALRIKRLRKTMINYGHRFSFCNKAAISYNICERISVVVSFNVAAVFSSVVDDWANAADVIVWKTINTTTIKDRNFYS